MRAHQADPALQLGVAPSRQCIEQSRFEQFHAAGARRRFGLDRLDSAAVRIAGRSRRRCQQLVGLLDLRRELVDESTRAAISAAPCAAR